MKKVLVLTNLLMLAVIAYLIFFWHNNPKTAGVMANRCQEIHCKSYASSGMNGMIDLSVAQQMADAYKADEGKKWIGSGPSDKTQDALSVWFDMETLKRFIWKIEDTVCKKSCDKPLKLGVRIYYAKYPSKAIMASTPDLNTVKPEFEYHHTVFMVPTYDVGSGDAAKHVDFDPWNMGSDPCRPMSLRKWMEMYPRNQQKEPRKIQMLMLGGTPPTGGDEQNHGDLRPPPADDAGFPSEG